MTYSTESAFGRRFLAAESAGKCFYARTDLDRHRVATRTAKHTLVRVHTALYARTAYWEHLTPVQRHLHVMRTLQDIHPEWVFCDVSAATVLGLQVPAWEIGRVNLLVKNVGQRQRANIVRHQLAQQDCITHHGVAITRLARTVFDCCQTRSLSTSLAVADSALDAFRLTKENYARQFEMYAATAVEFDRAVRVLKLARPQSPGGAWSYARGIMIQEGYAAPDVRAIARDPNDYRHGAFVDFRWRRPDGVMVYAQLTDNDRLFERGVGADATALSACAARRTAKPIVVKGVASMNLDFAQVLDRHSLVQTLDAYGVPRVRG